MSITALILLSITNIVYAKSTETITMDDAIYYAKTGFKVLFACSQYYLLQVYWYLQGKMKKKRPKRGR